MKVLLVTLYFPPAGGGGVQRPLKFATHLPALGIETHVLAPANPKWIHMDDELRPPTQAWVHRVRYFGPKGRRPSEELHGKQGLDRLLTQASLLPRRLVVPDEAATWNLTSIPAALRIARAEGIDVVLTTSPPGSVHLVGATLKRALGIRWIADLRDSLLAHQDRRSDTLAVRMKGQTARVVANAVVRGADAVVAAFDSIAEEMRELSPAGRVETIAFVPRRRSLELQRDSEALLLIAAEAGGRGTGVIPGKVFEYIAAGRPILAAVPPGGGAAQLIKEIGAGLVAPADDV